MRIGTIANLWRYPVKSLRGHALTQAAVDDDGFRGDRTSALMIESGHARAGKELRGKEHDGLHRIDDASRAQASALARGIRTTIHTEEGRYFDAAPVSLILDTWLAGLRSELGYVVEHERFRPNIFVEADPAYTGAEDDLLDATIAIGAVRLRVRSTIKRCVTTTYHLQDEPSDPRVLRYVASERDAVMGIYCAVERPGELRSGDAVTVIARGDLRAL